MFDRRMIRDVAFAVLLALPTLSLSRPAASEPARASAADSAVLTNAAMAELGTGERRHAIPD